MKEYDVNSPWDKLSNWFVVVSKETQWQPGIALIPNK